MTLLTSHAACGKSWKQRGNRTGHCSGCHHTFEGITLFDLHRRGGVCANPAEMKVGGLPLVFDGTHGDGAWSADPSILKAAFQGRETGEGTSGTGNASEAANRHLVNQSEGVPALLPTIPGYTHGVVGIDPTRLQCDVCGEIETPKVLVSMRTKFYGYRHGDLRRLCESCAEAAGYGVRDV